MTNTTRGTMGDSIADAIEWVAMLWSLCLSAGCIGSAILVSPWYLLLATPFLMFAVAIADTLPTDRFPLETQND